MPFNINAVPFYKAVQLFEDEKYPEAFELFLACAKKGNLYALFYLEHLLKTLDITKIALTEDSSYLLKSLNESLQNISQLKNADAWYKASMCILRYKKEQREKFQQKILAELESLALIAPNAAVFVLSKERAKMGDKPSLLIGKQSRLLKQAMEGADLFLIFHLIQMKLVSEEALQEWPVMEKFASFAYSNAGGNLERLIAKHYSPGTKNGFTPNDSRLYKWQITGAYMGCKELQFMFSQPGRTKKSEAEKDQWLRLAAKNGEAQAQIIYGFQCHNEGNDIDSRIFLEKGIAQKEQVKDFLLGQGLSALGKLQEDGLGGFEKNDTEALKLYQRSAELGFPVAIGNIGVFYEHGRGGLEKNYAKAVIQFQNAIKNGKENMTEDTVAGFFSNIGDLYCKGGYGLEINYQKAAENYRQSLEFYPTTTVLSEYGRLLYTQIPGVENIEESLRCLKLAADKNDKNAAYVLVAYFVGEGREHFAKYKITEKMIEQYLKLIKEASKSNIIEYRHSIMGMFYTELSRKPDLKMAFECFQRGALENEPVSLARLGNLYEHGCPELQILPNAKLAYEYYQRGAELEDSMCLNNLGFFLANGIGVEKDPKKGREYLELALKNGNKMAGYNLAVLYRNGNGVDRDLKQYFEYLKVAEETEDEDVLYELGFAYDRGHCVTIDPMIACQYYEKAWRKGVTAAAHNYVTIKINQAIHNKTLPYTLIEDLIEKLALPAQKGYAHDIYLLNILKLCLDHSLKATVIAELNASIARKPHKPSSDAIEYLSRSNTIDMGDCVILLASRDPLSFLKEQEQKKSSEKSNENKDNAMSSAASNGAGKGGILIMQKKTGKSQLKSKQLRYQKEISQFIDPKEIKSIDFDKFKHLLKEISIFESMELEVSSSKGSNKQFCLSDGDRTLCFSYHPRHKNGSGQDAAFDPKRARSLQSFIKRAAKI